MTVVIREFKGVSMALTGDGDCRSGVFQKSHRTPTAGEDVGPPCQGIGVGDPQKLTDASRETRRICGCVESQSFGAQAHLLGNRGMARDAPAMVHLKWGTAYLQMDPPPNKHLQRCAKAPPPNGDQGEK